VVRLKKRGLFVVDFYIFRIQDLRHSFASLAINNGASLYEVQHLLGHSQAKTTSRYAHLGDDTLRKVSDNISNMISNAIA
jgi:integrase